MKIWGNVRPVSGVYNKTNGVGKTGSASQVQKKKDSLMISDHAKDFQTVLKALKDVPDVRESIVNDLTDRYEKGEYKVEANKVSEHIMYKLSEKRNERL